jgi:outer membrane protein TolC
MLLSVFTSLRRDWRALLILLGLIVGPSLRAQPAGVAGTMPEDYLPELKVILANAVKQAPVTISKAIEVEARQANVIKEDAARLPHLSSQLDYARNTTAYSDQKDSGSTNNGLFGNVGANVPLFQWGALKNQSDRARISLLIAQKNYDEAYRTLGLLLRRSYLDLIVKKSQLLKLRFNRDLKAKDVELTTEKVKDGRASAGELAGKQLDLDDYVIVVGRFQVEFASIRRSFSRLAGMSPGLTEDAVPSDVPKPKVSADLAQELLSAMMREGGRSTFQAQVAELKVKEADLTYRIQRVQQLPKFGLGASYNLESTTNASGNTAEQKSVTRKTVSLGVSWNIFDGWATRGAKREALANRRLSERELQNATEASLDAAQGMAELLPLEAESMRMADLRRGLSEGLLKTQQEELELGKIPENSLLVAKAGLKESEWASAAARAAYLYRWAEFVSFVSTDPVLNNLPARHDREKR